MQQQQQNPPPPHLFEVPIRLHSARAVAKRKREPEDDTTSSRSASPQSDDDDDDEDAEQPLAPNFPHAPSRYAFDLPSLSGRLPPRPQRNIKHQHFAALNAILHRSLLDRDFARAHRAFALLLRFDLNGRHVDLRQKGLWGIGAEILLNYSPERSSPFESMETAETASEQEESPSDPVQWYSDECFEAAKAYFERLILQYPFRTNRPYAVDAFSFYPSLFGLWVMQVQARQIRRLARDEDDHDSINADALQQARQIADRIDGVTRLPPHNTNIELARLKGMITLWIVALGDQVSTSDARQQKALRNKAQAAFDIVLQQGGSIPEDVLEAARRITD